MKHDKNPVLEYRFFFFFLDFFFSRRGDGEGLSELLTGRTKKHCQTYCLPVYSQDRFCAHQVHFLTCLCSCFSFSSSDCVSWEENLNCLNLPPTWERSKGNRNNAGSWGYILHWSKWPYWWCCFSPFTTNWWTLQCLKSRWSLDRPAAGTAAFANTSSELKSCF